MELMATVVVVDAAVDSDVAIHDLAAGGVRVAQNGAIRAVGQEEPASRVRALDGGVGVHVQSAHQRRTIHDQMQAAKLGRLIKYRL